MHSFLLIVFCRTLLAFKNRKKRRRSDSEGSEIEKTPPPSPPPEEDSNVSFTKSMFYFVYLSSTENYSLYRNDVPDEILSGKSMWMTSI